MKGSRTFKSRILSTVILFLLAVATLSSKDASAAEGAPSSDPELSSLFPLAGQLGTLLTLEIRGRRLAGYKHGQWDTHSNNDKTLRDMITPFLDQTLSALLEDLEQRGLLDSTAVIVTGEFGRTPEINPKKGRDHWPQCWSLVVGGGGIQGGRIIGASDETGGYVAERPVSIGDLYATVYKALGIDWSKTYMAPVGRPVYIANGFDDVPGKPIQELI